MPIWGDILESTANVTFLIHFGSFGGGVGVGT